MFKKICKIIAYVAGLGLAYEVGKEMATDDDDE